MNGKKLTQTHIPPYRSIKTLNLALLFSALVNVLFYLANPFFNFIVTTFFFFLLYAVHSVWFDEAAVWCSSFYRNNEKSGKNHQIECIKSMLHLNWVGWRNLCCVQQRLQNSASTNATSQIVDALGCAHYHSL